MWVERLEAAFTNYGADAARPRDQPARDRADDWGGSQDDPPDQPRERCRRGKFPRGGHRLRRPRERDFRGAKSPAPATGAAPKLARSACEAHRGWIEEQVGLGRNAQAIYQDLVERFAFTHRYNSVKRFVRTLRRADDAHVVLDDGVSTAKAGFAQHFCRLALRGSGSNKSPHQRHLRVLVLFIATPKGHIMPADTAAGETRHPRNVAALRPRA